MVDGALVAEANKLPYVDVLAERKLTVGAAAGATNFQGAVDEVRMYAVVRNFHAEASVELTPASAAAKDAALLAYYPFSQAHGRLVADVSGYAMSGSVVGGDVAAHSAFAVSSAPVASRAAEVEEGTRSVRVALGATDGDGDALRVTLTKLPYVGAVVVPELSPAPLPPGDVNVTLPRS
eukprot:2867097-Pyramimonas_sp.AAC.1